VAALAWSCGGAQAYPTDGGVPECTMVITVSPPAPVLGDQVDLDGAIDKVDISGLETYGFTVTYAGNPVALDERDPFDGSRMSFTPAAAGPYRVVLSGSVGALGCTDDDLTVNVTDPGANTTSFRFRFLPASGQPAPAQERYFDIPGGAAYDLGDVGLDNGIAVSGTVSDGGGPLPGYLRIEPSGGGNATETFADFAGHFDTRVAAGAHDVLVVPDGAAMAPARLDGLSPAALQDLVLGAGEPIAGTVVDPGGAPVAGAQVSLRVAGVPSTLATTDGSGGFVVQARPGGATSLTVTPPPGSGLPRLDVDESAGLVVATGVDLTIRYASGVTSRTVSLAVRQSDGSTPAPAATVLWIAGPIAAAGSVIAGGGSPLPAAGTVRLTAVADGSGQISGLVVPETVFTALVIPAAPLSGQAMHLVAVDLSTGNPTPATLALAAPATVAGQVSAGGAPLSGVEVRAGPRGLLANQPQAAATATTGGDGSFALALVGGGDYQLALVPRTRTRARVLVDATAPGPGSSSDLGDQPLPAAIRVGGRVTISGLAAAAGVSVEVYCTDCTGLAAQVPVAEAVTDASGRFAVAIPDPGVGP